MASMNSSTGEHYRLLVMDYVHRSRGSGTGCIPFKRDSRIGFPSALLTRL